MRSLTFALETYLQRTLSFGAYSMYKNLSKELGKRSARTITLSDVELLNVAKVHNMYFTQKAITELMHKKLVICAASGDRDGRTTYSLRLPAFWRVDVPEQDIA